MFIRIQKQARVKGEDHLYASLVENRREGKKIVQHTVAYLGAVTPEQVPYLKAAYAKVKPRLVWDDPPAAEPAAE